MGPNDSTYGLAAEPGDPRECPLTVILTWPPRARWTSIRVLPAYETPCPFLNVPSNTTWPSLRITAPTSAVAFRATTTVGGRTWMEGCPAGGLWAFGVERAFDSTPAAPSRTRAETATAIRKVQLGWCRREARGRCGCTLRWLRAGPGAGSGSVGRGGPKFRLYTVSTESASMPR